MINKSELRIGNTIQSQGNIFTVSEINERYINCIDGSSFFDFKVNGVEFNDSLFELCGFEQTESTDNDKRKLWSIQVANNTSLYFDESNNKQWYLSYQWNNNHFQNDFWNSPKYLHQLQNLFFCLSGEELKIKL